MSLVGFDAAHRRPDDWDKTLNGIPRANQELQTVPIERSVGDWRNVTPRACHSVRLRLEMHETDSLLAPSSSSTPIKFVVPLV